jgi:hypothetical protein
VTGATPLSRREWRLSNVMTAAALARIGENGGPRCCKRCTFLALREAIALANAELGVTLEGGEDLRCEFSSINRECLREVCTFFAQS